MNDFRGILGILAILGIAYLLSNNKTKICWDCDSSFTNNSISQAGYFFRKYKDKTKPNQNTK